MPGEYNQNGAITLKPKINLEVADDFNFGLSLKTDTKALQEIMPQFVYTGQMRAFSWMRADITRKVLMFGCDQNTKDYFRHSYEAIYGWDKDFKGIKDYPLVLRSGVAYELSDDTEISHSVTIGQNFASSMEIEHKFDKNWTVGASQSFDSEGLGKPQGPYHVGFSASYKL